MDVCSQNKLLLQMQKYSCRTVFCTQLFKPDLYVAVMDMKVQSWEIYFELISCQATQVSDR